METVQLVLSPAQSRQSEVLKKALATSLQVPFEAIKGFRVLRESVDARQKNLKVLLTVQAFLSEQELSLPPYEKPVYQDVHNASQQVIVVGGGPAGLFAALTLLEHGIRPLILERGKAVSDRKRDIATLNRNEGLCAQSNYCFGEGGAGTFSDGKLFSRSKKRGNMQRVMEVFHFHGAPDSVLYETHAHIGSDCLPRIVAHMRETILSCGGRICFGEQMTHLLLSPTATGQQVVGVETLSGQQYLGSAVVLAIGHSAHDTYRALFDQGVTLQSKGFAMGVRVEHPQALIDRLLYHGQGRGDYLPAAAYSLVTQVQGRGVYSFCMCPGGHMVPATSSDNACVVNGMSVSQRNSPYANSGFVVEIREEDLNALADYIPSSTPLPLRGLAFQERMEELAFEHGEPPSKAPAQRLKDFVEGHDSLTLPPSSYLPGVVPSRLDLWLPPFVSKRLQAGFRDFDRKYKGFLTNDALLLGVESRSSSAVRIPRQDNMQHLTVSRLYPCGEGAGYAGGITSSALDGINAALQIVQLLPS